MNFPVATTHEPPVIESEHRDHQFPHLPERSRAKLAKLRAHRDDERALLEAAMVNLRDLRAPDAPYADAARELHHLERTNRFVPNRDPSPAVQKRVVGHAAILQAATERVDQYKAEIDAADKVREERGKRWQVLARLCTQLDRWLGENNRSLTEVAADVVLTEGQNPLEELEQARALIRALTAERPRIERAAMSLSEVKAHIRRWVDGRAAKVSPKGLISRTATIDIIFGVPDEQMALLCWLDPDRMVRRLEKEAEAQLDGLHSMSELEQARASRDVGDRLLAAERREEALIEHLAAQGSVILRRGNADPRAVLSVE